MKNPHFLGWSPMFHWTDSKIQVHAFYCVLALLLTSLLQRELAQKGEPLSINRMLEELGGIRETLMSIRVAKANGRPPPSPVLPE
jgi:transposase